MEIVGIMQIKDIRTKKMYDIEKWEEELENQGAKITKQKLSSIRKKKTSVKGKGKRKIWNRHWNKTLNSNQDLWNAAEENDVEKI